MTTTFAIIGFTTALVTISVLSVIVFELCKSIIVTLSHR